MSNPPLTSYLFYWNLKTPADNNWHPYPGLSSTTYLHNLPPWSHRLDLAATAVDSAPFIALTGFWAYIRQYNDLGWTVKANPFVNKPTMTAMHRSAWVVPAGVLGCQALGVEYRYAIPRWASEREKARDEDQARQHVETGMLLGGAVMVGRSLAGLGPRWSLLDVVMGGALFDLALREYYKAHGIGN